VNSRILLVEDEPGVAMVVADLLRAQGHIVEIADNGESGLRKAVDEVFDLLILDIMLPGLNGIEVCQSARERGFDGAILMLTAKGQVTDRVQGLREGADDYVVKPFAPLELVARTEALLRRVHKKGLTPVECYRFGNINADFANLVFHRNGQPVNLAGKEIELLRLLINHRGRVVTRQAILEHVWKQQKFITVRTVDVHIAWLRQKLEDNPQSPKFIMTVRGEGYSFRP
jgi:two-component system, OmpR family, alkaline phosphatase synthesis response regulator PhoP